MVRALPEAGRHAMGAPIPEPLEVADETMHLSYAIQWFGFAAIIAIGSLSLALRGARRSRGGRT
jgi:cytochrome oxidase assembly protein ShyY1